MNRVLGKIRTAALALLLLGVLAPVASGLADSDGHHKSPDCILCRV